MVDLPQSYQHVQLIRRPNIGYDFYSYRTGLTELFKNHDADGIFLLNSSFILLNTKRFSNLLRQMADKNHASAVRGATASSQIDLHLQSYLLYFDLKKLPKNWLQDFFKTVQPANKKSELILAYEIGLSQQLQKNHISIDSIFKPSAISRLQGSIAWIRRRMPSAERLHLLKPRTWKNFGGINWTHFAALNLAEQYGFVKAEVMCVNPYKFNLEPILSVCEKKRLTEIQKTITCIKNNHADNQSKTASKALTYRIFNSDIPRQKNTRVAVAIHLYYFDLLEEILSYLKHITEPFDLYITTPFEADVFPIFNLLKPYQQNATIMLIENRGRDIAPFIALYRSGLLKPYDAVLKLHTKKSTYDNKLGTFWRKQLYQALCVDKSTVAQSLDLLRNKHTGMIGPEKYFIRHWGHTKNKQTLSNILSTAAMNIPESGPELGFFAGTMFWFAPKAFEAIQKIPDNASTLQFEPEPTEQDGALAHAWERAFCLFSHEKGYAVSSLSLGGKDIFIHDPMNKSIPIPPGFSIPKYRNIIRGFFIGIFRRGLTLLTQR
jgi:lipopolysaccharide biosynthesis protein